MHWLADYIGKPWEAGERGPQAFDCYGLVWHIYKHRLGVELPTYPIAPNRFESVWKAYSDCAGSLEWKPVASPEAFDVVGMGRKGIVHHLGLFLESDGGLVLHAEDGQNVSAQGLDRIREKYRRIEFYRHAENS